MICPYCGADQSACIDSRQMGEVRGRRYSCLACGERYYTRERTVTKNFRRRQIEKELLQARKQTETLREALVKAVESCDGILAMIDDQSKGVDL